MKKEQFEKFKSLVDDLMSLIDDDSMTWEQKNHVVFYTPGLANEICESGLMKVADYNSSDKEEVMAFYNAAAAKVKYLEYYFKQEGR